MLWQHPALGLTVGYLAVSLLGIAYEWTLFRHFGVNFFHYAEVADFLMGAFREPITFVLALTALAAGMLAQLQIDWEDRWFARRETRSRLLRAYRRFSASTFIRLLPILFFLGYSVMFIWLYSGYRAETLRAGGDDRIHVMLVEKNPVTAPAPALLLGTSARSVFLFDARTKVTSIVPHENIAWIRVAAPAGTP
jgi:hypothetical protein